MRAAIFAVYHLPTMSLATKDPHSNLLELLMRAGEIALLVGPIKGEPLALTMLRTGRCVRLTRAEEAARALRARDADEDHGQGEAGDHDGEGHPGGDDAGAGG